MSSSSKASPSSSSSSISSGPYSSFSRGDITLQPPYSDIRTLPELIEYNAIRNSDYPFCIQAKKIGQGAPIAFLSISHLQLKRAILECSEWLQENIAELQLPSPMHGGRYVKGPPVALFAESDAGLLIYKLSLIGLGVPVLLLSARLSPTAIHHLLGKTGAKAILVSPRLQNTAKEALSLFSIVEDTPTLYTGVTYESFLSAHFENEGNCGSICQPGHYIDENDRNVLILHSSGTTGLPKPIYTSHRHLLCFTVCHDFSSTEEARGLCLSTLPLYHGFGLVTPCLSLGAGMTFCMIPPSVVPTGAAVVDLLNASNARSLISVPSILEEVARLPEETGIKALVELQFVGFGGGRLKPIVGEKLEAAGVKLLNHYGTTESGPISPIFCPKDDYDWRYFRMRKDMDLRLETVPLTGDKVQRYTLITHPFGWGTSFPIQDQLITNPQNPLIDFNVIGRNDDVIVLATGEKVIPRILEDMLSENELVNVAVAFGEGQFELGVLVQPSAPLAVDQYVRFKSFIWPVIVEAGERMDAHARISSMDAIIVIPPTIILSKSDKGSIMRKEVYKVFESEITKVYRDLENNVSETYLHPLRMNDLEQGLRSLIQSRLNWRVPAGNWTCEDDLFELGMDSLQAVQLRRFLLSSVPRSGNSISVADRIPRDIVYRNPSVSRLAQAIRISEGFEELELVSDRSIDQFVEQFSIKERRASTTPVGRSVVLLTGASGSLGTYLMAHLANHPDVARVICLNRPSPGATQVQDPLKRQLKSAESKGISISQQTLSNIEVLHTNMALPQLGLTDEQYARLREQVTHILHNAWPMDFKIKLPSFQAQFQSLQNLLALAKDAHETQWSRKPKLLFVSSIAVVGQYPVVKQEIIVPEQPMMDEKCANKIGYAEAKLVCERIIENAARDYANQMEVAYVRVGQMSGSTNSGFWNANEYFPALVKSSVAVGSLPKLEGTFSWIPVECAAEAMSDILLNEYTNNLVYHLENPIRQPWHDTLAVLASILDLPNTEIIPFNDWLKKICALGDDLTNENPAKKLTEFFERDFKRMACGNVILDTSKTRTVSPILRTLRAVSPEVIASYICYWRKIGYLQPKWMRPTEEAEQSDSLNHGSIPMERAHVGLHKLDARGVTREPSIPDCCSALISSSFACPTEPDLSTAQETSSSLDCHRGLVDSTFAGLKNAGLREWGKYSLSSGCYSALIYSTFAGLAGIQAHAF